MVFSLTGPPINCWLVLVFEGKENVLSIAEKGVGWAPVVLTEASELVAILVLYYHDGVFVFLAALEESDETAAIYVDTEQPLPVGGLEVTWKFANQIANLQVTQNATLVRLGWHELDEGGLLPPVLLHHD